MKREPPPVKPKITLPSEIVDRLSAEAREKADERRLREVRVITTGDLLLKPPKVLKTSKIKQDSRNLPPPTSTIGGVFSKLRRGGG
jgi:hypothetical protein